MRTKSGRVVTKDDSIHLEKIVEFELIIEFKDGMNYVGDEEFQTKDFDI